MKNYSYLKGFGKGFVISFGAFWSTIIFGTIASIFNFQNPSAILTLFDALESSILVGIFGGIVNILLKS